MKEIYTRNKLSHLLKLSLCKYDRFKNYGNDDPLKEFILKYAQKPTIINNVMVIKNFYMFNHNKIFIEFEDIEALFDKNYKVSVEYYLKGSIVRSNISKSTLYNKIQKRIRQWK